MRRLSLKLRLLTSGDSGKITDDNGVLSVATITKDTFNVTITNIADALSAASSTPLCLQGTEASVLLKKHKKLFQK